MDADKSGNLIVSLKKSEFIEITSKEEKIQIHVYDKYKQPLACRVYFKTLNNAEIKRKPKPEGGLK